MTTLAMEWDSQQAGNLADTTLELQIITGEQAEFFQ